MSNRFYFFIIACILTTPFVLGSCEGRERKDRDSKQARTGEQEGVTQNPDPWLTDLRKPYMKYTGVILFHYTGPDGQKATWPKHSLVLTESEADEIRSGDYRIAICWPSLDDVRAKSMQQGVLDACRQWGLSVVQQTDAGNDSDKQISDIESAIAQNPDALIAEPLDLEASAASFKKASEAGIKLAFIMNRPQGLVHGQDYIGIIAPNNNDRALIAANMMADILSKDTHVALITYETDIWDIAFTDELVKDTLKGRYPGIRILAHETFDSFQDAGEIAESIIEQFPEIEGMYTSNVYSALPIAEALRKTGRDDVKIITTNMNEGALINMVEGGNIAGTSADTTYYIGVDAVVMACFGILGKEGPEFAVSPVMPVSRDTIREAWELTKRIPLPDSLEQVLQETGSQ
jgi:ribose transport system substrate-binding protein